MKKRSFYLMKLIMAVVVLMTGFRCEAQSVDELQIKIKKLEAQNSALEAKLKKSTNKNSKNSAEQERQMDVLRGEIDRLRNVIEERDADEAARAQAELSKKTVKIAIKDPVFMEYLNRYCDMDDDGVFTQWDAEHTYIIDIAKDKSLLRINNTNIASLEGIEYFVNLRRLVCSGNAIPQIDLSKNVNLESLIANGCELKLLNVSKNENLVRLECNNNLLYTIDLSSNRSLQKLDLYKNKIAVLDLSGCENLKTLICSDNTLTSLDVSNNVELELVNCSNNKLVQLSFVNNKKLVDIDISNNNLISVDLQNGMDINYIDCTKNKDLEYVILSKGKRALADRKDAKTRYK